MFFASEREKEQLLRSKITKLKDKKSTNNWFILNNSLKNAVAKESQYSTLDSEATYKFGERFQRFNSG